MKRIFNAVLLGRVLLLWNVFAASAGQYEDGLAAYNKGDYATALKLLRPMAEQGDAKAELTLGDMYERGLQDHQEAVKWFRKAAEQFRKAADHGDAFAEFVLAGTPPLSLHLSNPPPPLCSARSG